MPEDVQLNLGQPQHCHPVTSAAPAHRVHVAASAAQGRVWSVRREERQGEKERVIRVLWQMELVEACEARL